MPDLKITLRRTRTLLWTAFSIIVVALAIGAGVGKLLMPYSVHYQPELEQWLSREFGRPVSIASFEGEWTAFGPRLTLRGLALMGAPEGDGAGSPEVLIESAALDIRPLGHFLANLPLYNFRVIGADFELVRGADGDFHLSGLGVSNRESGSALQDLVRVGEVVLEDSSLLFIDEVLGIRLALTGIDGRLDLDGETLSSRLRAVLHDPRSGLEYGELDGTAILELADEKLKAAEWHLNARDLMLASFQGKVPSSPFLPLTGWLEGRAWGVWSNGEGLRINGSVELEDALVFNNVQDIHLNRAESRFRWRYAGAGHWNLHLADFFLDRGDASWRSPRLSVARDVSQDVGLWIGADQLPLGAPLNLTREVMSIYGREWPENAPVQVDGQVSELDLVLSADWNLKRARGRIDQAHVKAWNRWPELNGLTGQVDLEEGFGEVLLAGRRVDIRWPAMFDEPLAFEIPPCRVELEWRGVLSGGFRGCGIENEDLALHGDLFIFADGGRPSVDGNFLVSRAEIGQLGPYWPTGVMRDSVVTWLRRGLRGGQIDSARAQVFGDLDDWPFGDGAGRFDVVAQINEPVIRYLDDWPEVRGGSAVVARFEGAGMEVRGAVSNTGGAAVEDVFVAIPDFSRPLLDVRYRTETDLPTLLTFVGQTPLLERTGVDLSAFEFSGSAGLDGQIRAPLGHTPGELDVAGTVNLGGAAFAAPQHQVEIQDIAGRIEYDERGFGGSELEGVTLDEPVRIGITARSEADETFRAELQGEFDVQALLSYDPLRSPLHERMAGRSEWTIALSAGDRPLTLDMRSSLEGVAFDFPAPLDKAPDARWPFRLTLPLGANGVGPLRIGLDQRGAVAIDIGEEGIVERAAVALGSGQPELPPKGLLRVRGAVSELDLDGWIGLAVDHADLAKPDGLKLEALALQAQDILFLDRRFSDVGLGLDASDGDLQATFDSAEIDGRVRFSRSSGSPGSLFAEFERLVLGPALSSGVSTETDPNALPVLHLYANSFSYLGIELGETRIEAYPTPTGLHFEKVEATSEALFLQASGDWIFSDGAHHSDFRINMASESLGDFLRSLDISSSVQGGQTLVGFNAQWEGSPANFALSRLNGEVEFSVIDGNITGADAGPGRLLGLVSFAALPKRLALDFRDVFESGFSFDQANGSFLLQDGVAVTDDLLLESSSASISLSGRTDLVERRYDQLLTIRPGVGNTLPIIGALAAGPGGAAAGLALQGLLHDSLAEATQVRYTITGSWDEPLIEPVEVKRAGG